MNEILQHYIIDLSSNNNFVQVPAVQGDGNATRYIEIELIENGTQYVIGDDVVVTIVGTKPDTKEIWNTCEVTEEGYILVPITYQMTAVAGRGDYMIMLFSSGTNNQLKSFPFFILVTAATFDPSYITSTDEFETLIYYTAEAQKAVEEAQEAVEKAEDAVEDAEAWAIGERGGSPVVPTDPTYHNNSKWYSEQAATSETNAATSETNAATSETNAANSEANAATSETNAANSEANAATSEANAATSETNAADSADVAKSWAVGPSAPETSGTDTNNAKYWCEQAEAIVGLGPFLGATATTNGQQGLVPGPAAGMQDRVLFGDATWKALNLVFQGTTAEWAATTNKAFYKIVILTDD